MKNIGIICGGFSSEFEISVLSGTNIYSNFPKEYSPYLILMRREGWTVKIGEQEIPMNRSNLTFTLDGELVKMDYAIVYIHGDPGENGKLQAYLEMIDVPYINSGPLASQLSFDKWYCNQFLKGFGVNVAESIYLTKMDEIPDSKEIIEKLGLPLFVKPTDSGSSYGIAKVNKIEELANAIERAFDEGDAIVMESFLDGQEVTCGVYRNKDGARQLPLTEIISENEFFDYEAKYKGLSQEITPARISDELTAQVKEIAMKIYQLLNLRSIARVDFMLVNGVPHVIEVNTTPGFSKESIVPKMIKAEGLSIEQFWREILQAEL